MMTWIKAVWGQKRIMIFRWEICLLIVTQKATLMGQMRESKREKKVVMLDQTRFIAIGDFD